ncbi:Type IV secretion system protein VirB6 [Bartonella clarridgeiae 73]|uniref:Type IV secretion system protein VirB6 n=1 Tax=Bartonella clarridgeiae (strain CCUG 45776 / CIP 104772 / 73) TaxID=696125 RepID=E6YFW9_BARC7|nr:type IV secretion system protein [Bartonella clarridgeiae]WCR55097.1 MAG: Inner membrane protein of type IV secretion of T-DNA complex VirB6 [Bartonella clarridgeiae]WCR55119.1 MAG: Inner membrane protein of type IV secretion of T-DNA complex VirB6 [Bartonella clarridgeiae]WCR55633.1 MAG: Inner membrane protein of type IV secretion of T-DNA complex VirB6 [Bartonella clarridgeiae]CBI75757.1 Type IV secretion system protein VirB6 [Bartonella clarridgeiae 73]CBI76304.1 Type IV secretion system
MSDFKFTPFASVSSYILIPLNDVVDSTVSSLSSAVAAPLNLAAIIFIFLYGYNVMTGHVALSMHSLLNNVVKIIIVTTMATNADVFNTYVKGIFFGNLANAIGNAFNSNPVDADVFDYILLMANTRYQDFVAKAWLFDKIIVGLIGGLMFLAIIVFCTIGFIIQMFAKITLVMVISLGPIFISLYLFNVTRRYADAWISTLVNFTVLQVLVMFLGTMMCKITLYVFDSPYSSIYFLLPPVLVVSIVGSTLFQSLPTIASALSSGGPYHHAGTSAGSQMFSIASNALNLAGRGLNLGGSAARHTASGASSAAAQAAQAAQMMRGGGGRGPF